MNTTLQNLKTGCLIAFACESAAIRVQAPLVEQERLKQLGFTLGLAYQIQDDLLDVEGNAAQLGKPTGMDSDKRSIVIFMGTEVRKKYLKSLKDQMHNLIDSYNNPVFAKLISWVESRVM